MTASILGNDNYKAGDIGTYTITLTATTAPALGFQDQELKWGSPSQAQGPVNYNADTMGPITYTITSTTAGGQIGTDGVGKVINTSTPGTVTVTARTTDDSKYAVGTYTITVTHKDAPQLTITDPTKEEWGTEIVKSVTTGHILEEMGALKYVINDNGATNGQVGESTGVISLTDYPGKIVVDVSIVGGSKYAPGKIGQYTATVDRKTNEAINNNDLEDDEYFFNFTTAPYVEPPLNDYDEVEDGKRVYSLVNPGELAREYGPEATFDATTGEVKNITVESMEGKQYNPVRIEISTLGGTKYKPTPYIMSYDLYYY